MEKNTELLLLQATRLLLILIMFPDYIDTHMGKILELEAEIAHAAAKLEEK